MFVCGSIDLRGNGVNEGARGRRSIYVTGAISIASTRGRGSAIAQHVTETMRGRRWARLVGVVVSFPFSRTPGGGHVRCWKDLRGSDVRRGLARAESCEETPVGAARWTAIP